PARKACSASGLHCERDVLKCSVSQVNVSDDTSFFPVMWAAEAANFKKMGSGSTLRMSALSRRRPGTGKKLEPNVSTSGISTAAYKSIRLPGEPCAWFFVTAL